MLSDSCFILDKRQQNDIKGNLPLVVGDNFCAENGGGWKPSAKFVAELLNETASRPGKENES
jgi:hypothetical protein